jgi:hypothetical protein
LCSYLTVKILDRNKIAKTISIFITTQNKIKGRIDCVNDLDFLIFGVLTPLSAMFQLYHGDQF